MRRWIFSLLPLILVSDLSSETTSLLIRVLLAKTKNVVQITSTEPFTIVMDGVSKLYPAREWVSFRPGRKGVEVDRKSTRQAVLVQPGEAGYLQVNKKRYRGDVQIRLQKGQLYVINRLTIEDYLQGVVPKEVPAAWPTETLKAQAVVSRTFAAANRGQYEKLGYDLGADYFSQVYGGLDAENDATNTAVQETAGRVLYDEAGRLIQAYFHSSCGGRTDASTRVWSLRGKQQPYLIGIDDEGYCREDPNYRWAVKVSESFLRRKLERAGFKCGSIRMIYVAEESASGRARTVRVDGKKKSVKLSGQKLRLLIGPENLRSTYFEKIEPAGSYFRFTGRGWGHGVGMCQWGARGRALDGQTYDTILATYYPTTVLGQLP